MSALFEAGDIGGEAACQGVPMLEFSGEGEAVSCAVRSVTRYVNTHHINRYRTAVS